MDESLAAQQAACRPSPRWRAALHARRAAQRPRMRSPSLGLCNLRRAWRPVRVCLQMRFAGMMQYDGELLLPKHFLVGHSAQAAR